MTVLSYLKKKRDEHRRKTHSSDLVNEKYKSALQKERMKQAPMYAKEQAKFERQQKMKRMRDNAKSGGKWGKAMKGVEGFMGQMEHMSRQMDGGPAPRRQRATRAQYVQTPMATAGPQPMKKKRRKRRKSVGERIIRVI